eukprot:Ihof_evm1s550 gene=Ihof_evmTU1s550
MAPKTISRSVRVDKKSKFIISSNSSETRGTPTHQAAPTEQKKSIRDPPPPSKPRALTSSLVESSLKS